MKNELPQHVINALESIVSNGCPHLDARAEEQFCCETCGGHFCIDCFGANNCLGCGEGEHEE